MGNPKDSDTQEPIPADSRVGQLFTICPESRHEGNQKNCAPKSSTHTHTHSRLKTTSSLQLKKLTKTGAEDNPLAGLPLRQGQTSCSRRQICSQLKTQTPPFPLRRVCFNSEMQATIYHFFLAIWNLCNLAILRFCMQRPLKSLLAAIRTRRLSFGLYPFTFATYKHTRTHTHTEHPSSLPNSNTDTHAGLTVICKLVEP